MAKPLLTLLLLLLSTVSPIAGFLLQPPASSTSILTSILWDLGYQELAMAIFSIPIPCGPLTLFAPSDDSIRSCTTGVNGGCSPSRFLQEHFVPGLFPLSRLSQLPFASKLPTLSPNRCLSLTSTFDASTIFVSGVRISRPNLYTDATLIIHGLRGFLAPLSPSSCAPAGSGPDPTAALLLRDAIVRLRNRGFGILSLAMRFNSPELVRLEKMTVFALDDVAVFGGGGAYVHEVRFHVVPNRLLMGADLVRLEEGTVLPTMVKGQHLVVTGSTGTAAGLRLNYVPIKAVDVVINGNVVVHALFFPLPHFWLPGTEIGGRDEVVFGGGMEGSTNRTNDFVVPGRVSGPSGVVCGCLGNSSEYYSPAPAPVAKPKPQSGVAAAAAAASRSLSAAFGFLVAFLLVVCWIMS